MAMYLLSQMEPFSIWRMLFIMRPGWRVWIRAAMYTRGSEQFLSWWTFWHTPLVPAGSSRGYCRKYTLFSLIGTHFKSESTLRQAGAFHSAPSKQMFLNQSYPHAQLCSVTSRWLWHVFPSNPRDHRCGGKMQIHPESKNNSHVRSWRTSKWCKSLILKRIPTLRKSRASANIL